MAPSVSDLTGTPKLHPAAEAIERVKANLNKAGSVSHDRVHISSVAQMTDYVPIYLRGRLTLRTYLILTPPRSFLSQSSSVGI